MLKVKELWKIFSFAVVAAVFGLMMASCVETGDEEEEEETTPAKPGYAEVRFSWDGDQAPFIDVIAANDSDVTYWYETIYYPLYNDSSISDEDLLNVYVSHMAKYKGSPLLPKIYVNPSWGPTSTGDVNKSVYFDIDAGNYTAVCTVIDPEFDDTYDIVANYKITNGTNGATKYHEIAFDVYKYLSGVTDHDAWIKTKTYDKDNTTPLLEKKKAGFLKKVQKDDVTYYVFKRPKA